VRATRNGYVTGLAAEAIGRAAVGLGAGRDRLDAVIDPGVGLTIAAPVGTAVRAGDALVLVRHRGGRGLEEAVRLVSAAVTIGDAAPAPSALIVDRIHGRKA
jgi:thymidine phosphorylase